MQRNSARTRTAAVYNAASDNYDDPANSFWSRYGRGTVARLHLPAGARVLDACCGSGASAIPAAEAVGPDGSVLGIDIAENLLALARRKAVARGLGNVSFRTGDILDLPPAGDGFDAVVCVFGIFFIPDMTSAVRALWRQVRPGGRLAVTTWGEEVFEPLNTAFWDAVRRVRPDLYKGFNPWDRISTPGALWGLLQGAGVEGAEVAAEPGEHLIPSPDAWWAMVLGSGYRGTVDQLDASMREEVRVSNVEFIRRAGVVSIRSDVIYAVGTKP